jgi:hypothetical protein
MGVLGTRRLSSATATEFMGPIIQNHQPVSEPRLRQVRNEDIEQRIDGRSRDPVYLLKTASG